jgi:hypothetical protein
VPRPVPRLGIDDNAKITAIQSTIGTHVRRAVEGIAR